ncbi:MULTISPECIES: AAA family ATPase [unclassified Stenotrophomonas]|uniref:McrB family protein n=1 Tax=unclassified Stenotrophomonas TaxID=196198 RepID=UPI000D16DEBE|nr:MULTISPECIES: AAA family ATPase [unclassified Stenotrophomonas]PTA71240.1 restriction endonuclease [Stenotrophomonas sp. Nf1]PTA83363.1 restriction endonuclease [Stenotrophomonas sp. Nf4]
MSEFFTQEHFNLLQSLQGKKFDQTDAAHQTAYNKLRQAYDLTQDWANRIKAARFSNGRVSIRRRATNQGNHFAGYNWAKIYPDAASPPSLAYTVGLNGHDGFVVKIDTVKLQDNNPMREAYLKLRGPFQSSPIVKVLPIDQGLSLGMEDLVAWSLNAIAEFGLSYDEVAKRIGQPDEVEPDAVLKHFDINEDFRTMRKGWTSEDTEQFCRLARLVHYSGMDWWFAGTHTHLRFGRKNAGSGRAVSVVGLVTGSLACRVTWRPELPSISKFVRKVISEKMVDNIATALDADDEALQELIRTDEEREGFWPGQADDDASTTSDPSDVDDNDEGLPAVQSEVAERLAFNRIYFGPPGTGKTYELKFLLDDQFTAEADEKSAFEGETERYTFVTFHQSYGYEDFIEGLRPVIEDSAQGQVRYEVRPGVFLKLCERARKYPDEMFAIVIDEINRGNISKIFGELITLIELDKRTGMKNCHSVTLPYSQQLFSVPRNVSIIGTMNTADRSLASLDTALRRRFEFEEVLPNSEDGDLAPLGGLRVNRDDVSIHIPKLLSAMNQRIEALYDREHLIGHAYFMPLKNIKEDSERMTALTALFEKQILPLLEEYFYDDWQKIRLVLGDNQKHSSLQFVQETTNDDQTLERLFGANAAAEGHGARPRFNRNPDALSKPDAYVGIYNTLLGNE